MGIKTIESGVRKLRNNYIFMTIPEMTPEQEDKMDEAKDMVAEQKCDDSDEKIEIRDCQE